MQTLKKIGMFIIATLIPLIVFLILTIIKTDLLTAAVSSIFCALILVIILWKFTDTPFTRMFEGRTFGCITIDSRGQIDFFDVQLQKDSFIGSFMGKIISVPFNQNFFFRISSFFGKGKLIEGPEKYTLTLEKKNINFNLFRTTYPILIWDKQLNTFITKEWLHEREKKDMLFALGYSIKTDIQEYNKAASSITRAIINLIGSKLQQQGWIFWLIILLVVGALLWQFWPQINQMLTGTIKSTTGAVGGVTLPEKLG